MRFWSKYFMRNWYRILLISKLLMFPFIHVELNEKLMQNFIIYAIIQINKKRMRNINMARWMINFKRNPSKGKGELISIIKHDISAIQVAFSSHYISNNLCLRMFSLILNPFMTITYFSIVVNIDDNWSHG